MISDYPDLEECCSKCHHMKSNCQCPPDKPKEINFNCKICDICGVGYSGDECMRNHNELGLCE